MFDFTPILKKGMDKIWLYYGIEDDPIYSKKFKRFIKWFAYKFSPFVMNVATFIILLNIFNRVNKAYGIDSVVILGLVIIIFILKGISEKLKKEEDEFKGIEP